MSYEMTYDQFQYISDSGIALDDDLNELRDSEGQIFVVPENDRHLFKTIIKNQVSKYRVYATQTVTYYIDVYAETRGDATDIAEGEEFSEWKECDYFDWDIQYSLTHELENENA